MGRLRPRSRHGQLPPAHRLGHRQGRQRLAREADRGRRRQRARQASSCSSVDSARRRSASDTPRGVRSVRIDPSSLRLLTDQLAALGRRERLSHITIDPGWVDPPPTDDGHLPGRPGSCCGRLAPKRRPVQHDRTRIVDLEDADRMWAEVRPRTQRYIKSARSAGITVGREGGGSHGRVPRPARRHGRARRLHLSRRGRVSAHPRGLRRRTMPTC